MWDAITGTLHHTFPPAQPISRIAFSGDGNVLAFVEDSARSFLFYSSWDGHLMQKIVIPNQAIDMEISNDGSEVITSSADSIIRVWNAANGSLINSFYGNQKSPISIFLTDSGDTLISGGSNSLCFWNWQTGTLLKTTTGGNFNKPIFVLPNGRVVNIQTELSDIKINDLLTGETIKTLWGESDYTSAYLTADGETLLTGDDGAILAYSLVPNPPVESTLLNFGSGGRYLIAKIGDGTMLVTKDVFNLFDNGNLVAYKTVFQWMSIYHY